MFAAVSRQRRVQRAAVHVLQLGALQGPAADVDAALRRRQALRPSVSRAHWTGGAAGGQCAGRHQVSARQSGHVYRRQVSGECQEYIDV